MVQRTKRLLSVLSLCFTWALISVHPIWKYLSHTKAAAATGLGLGLVALGMGWLYRRNRGKNDIGIGWLLVLFLAFTTAFAALYPLSLRHSLNAGSDREDALHVELTAIRQHRDPFDARTFLHNPPTPLPGAMLLAAPFFSIGHIAWQNLLWYALFTIFTIRFFRYRATALIFLLVFVFLAPANLSDLTDGGDYLTNFFYVAIAVGLFCRTLNRSLYVALAAGLFLGVVLSSRGIYVLILIPLLAYSLQRASHRRALVLFSAVFVASALVTLPILAPHAVTNLLHELDQTTAGKLRFIPRALHPRWILPLAATIVGGSAFFVRLNLPRIFLIFSATSFVMLAPFVVTFALHGLWQRLSYLSVCVLPFALWALSRYEYVSSDGNGIQ